MALEKKYHSTVFLQYFVAILQVFLQYFMDYSGAWEQRIILSYRFHPFFF